MPGAGPGQAGAGQEMLLFSLLKPSCHSRRVRPREWALGAHESKPVHRALKVSQPWDFSGGPAVKTLCFHCREQGFHQWSGKLRSLRGCTVWPKSKKKNKNQPSLSHMPPWAQRLTAPAPGIISSPPGPAELSHLPSFGSQLPAPAPAA